MSHRSDTARPLRVIISGGGTGGHIFPAIAIANAIKAQAPDTEFLFVGAEGKMEMQKVPQAGYKIVGLPVAGLQRRLTWKNLVLPFKVLASLRKAWQLVGSFRPDVAVGVGGYASGPMLLACGWKNIPILIQEQNSYAGLTNKFLARYAQRICVAYPGMERFFPADKIQLTGNPVRRDIAAQMAERSEAADYFGLSPQKPTLLIIGGSLGARTINESIHQGLAALAEAGVQILWQTGKAYGPTASEALLPYAGQGLVTLPFIDRMDLAYACADLVVSRAGALSLSELCVLGKPSVLVPSPNVSEDHQTQNALSLSSRGAAELVPDAEARQKLVPLCLRLLAEPARLAHLAQQAQALALPQADQTLAQEVLKLAGR